MADDLGPVVPMPGEDPGTIYEDPTPAPDPTVAPPADPAEPDPPAGGTPGDAEPESTPVLSGIYDPLSPNGLDSDPLPGQDAGTG